MNISSVISIIILFAFGIFMLVVGVVSSDELVGSIIAIVFGLISIGLGVYMIFNFDKEDRVERIKKNKNSK